MSLFSFAFGDTTYRLDLTLDDAAMMDDTVAFDLTATVERDGRQRAVSVRVEILPWENLGRIIVDGGTFEFTLADHGDSGLEQFLASIPVPDPLLGCAIKAGISSLIGQAIKCRREVESAGLWRSMQVFARCMRDHFGDIGRTALKRAFGCMISGGLL